MVVFDEILSELLMQNNCVVVPSLGGFVANTVSAKVDVNKGTITPPSKALSFNKSLTNNDGLLVNALAQKRTISYDEANESVATDVAKIKSRLNSGERVHFQNVGFLYLNNAGKMAFEQDRFFNLLLESYGMGSVQFVPVEEEKEEVKVAEVQTSDSTELKVVKGGVSENEKPIPAASSNLNQEVKEEISPSPKTSVLRKVVRYAAVAAFIPVAFYSFWIPMKTDVLKSGIIYSEDFNPFSESEGSKYLEGLKKDRIKADIVNVENDLDQITSNLTPNSGDVFSFPITEDHYVSVRYNKFKTTKDNSNESVQKGYHLIVGCFEEKENAIGMLEKLSSLGLNGIIVDKHQGLHRVSAANSQNREQLLEKRALIDQSGLSSWVLKK